MRDKNSGLQSVIMVKFLESKYFTLGTIFDEYRHMISSCHPAAFMWFGRLLCDEVGAVNMGARVKQPMNSSLFG